METCTRKDNRDRSHLGNNVIDLGQRLLESSLNVGRLQSRRLRERQACGGVGGGGEVIRVLAGWEVSLRGRSRADVLAACTFVAGKRSGVLCLHAAQVLEVAFIPHQPNHDVGVGVIPQLLQPLLHVVVRLCAMESCIGRVSA